MIDFIIVSPKRSVSVDEVGRLGGLQASALKRGRLFGQIAVHACLDHYLVATQRNAPPVRMFNSIFGKPEIESEELDCGFSYADNLAVFVIGGGQVGVDIQYDNINWGTLDPNKGQADCRHKLWVAREAVAKFLSVGLNIDLQKIDVPIISDKEWHRAKVNVFPFQGRDIFLREIPITHRYKAVVVADAPKRVRRLFMQKGAQDIWATARWS